MGYDPFVVRTADPLDEDQELAADLIANLGLAGVGSAKVPLQKIVHGALGVSTMTAQGASAFPVDQRYTSTGLDPVRVDLNTDSVFTILAGATSRLGAIIQNPGTIDVWIGFTNVVTTSGATTGQVLKANLANGGFQVPKEYRGNVYAIRAAGGTGAYVTIQAV